MDSMSYFVIFFDNFFLGKVGNKEKVLLLKLLKSFFKRIHILQMKRQK